MMSQLTPEQKLAVIELLFSSSDDEDDADIDEDAVLALSTKSTLPKVLCFIEDVVHVCTDKQFKEDFRVNRRLVYDLIELYERSEFFPKTQHSLASAVSAENHVLSFLWFAGNKVCLRDVAQRFGIGRTTLFRQLERVMRFLVSKAGEIITFPTTPERIERVSYEFNEIAGFPNVVGCIDGTSIHIRTPINKIKSTYCNRHDVPSITLQAICDAQRRFLDVFTGAPGKIHDARVYKLSEISRNLPRICGRKYHILGDGAYAIREWLLTPYKDYGNMTPGQNLYNKKFCATRVRIENSFGLLKARFRQLSELCIHQVDKITKFIVSCCVLHKICIDNNDIIEFQEITPDEINNEVEYFSSPRNATAENRGRKE